MLFHFLRDSTTPRFFGSIRGRFSSGHKRVEIVEGDLMLLAVQGERWTEISVYQDSRVFGVARDWRAVESRHIPTHDHEQIKAAIMSALDRLCPPLDVAEVA